MRLSLSLLSTALLTGLLGIAALPAQAENRGIVVVNNAYAGADSAGAVDGAPLAAAMRDAGLRTVSGSDLRAEDLRKAVADLLRPDDQAGIRLVLLGGRFLHDGRDSWLMGVDAADVTPFTLGLGGVSVSAVMAQMADAQPGAVLVLVPADGDTMPGAGLRDGLGHIAPPEGVTVLTGPAAPAVAAARALLVPGVSVQAALAADAAVSMVAGGDRALVLVGDDVSPALTPAEVERNLWAKAAQEDSAAAYQSYLDRFPQGAYSAAASSRLTTIKAASSDRDAWAEAAARHDRSAYETYLSRFPDGQYRDAARQRLAELTPTSTQADTPAQPRPSAAQQAESRLGLSKADRQQIQRNLNALNYQTGGVDGVLGSRSRQAISQWQRANGHAATSYLTAGQIQDLRRQAGAQQQSRDAADRDYWQKTGAKGGAANLDAYLSRYPNGVHAETARTRLRQINAQQGLTRAERDQRDYQAAQAQNTIQAFDTYLRNWPKGRFAKQARAQRDALQRGQQGLRVEDILDLNPEKLIREFLK